MLTTITGKPGMGKTLLLTYFSYKKFKDNNPPLKVWFKEHILRKKHVYILNCYTDYPVVFKKPKKGKTYLVSDGVNEPVEVPFITSLQCRIFDLFLENKFVPEAQFCFDEIQAKYDSMEYKDFPDSIAHYCQAHRHFDNDIFISSQSQSRIIKRLLVLSEQYLDIVDFKIKFGFCFLTIRRTWDMSATLENGVINDKLADVEYFRKIFRIKKVGSMYDSKYLRNLQENALNYPFKMYDSLQMNKQQLLNTFFPSNELKEKLKNMRY